jgi:hypothetical protein
MIEKGAEVRAMARMVALNRSVLSVVLTSTCARSDS